MWKVCWNKGRICWKIAKLFCFCHLKKLVRPETFGPYYVPLRHISVKHRKAEFQRGPYAFQGSLLWGWGRAYAKTHFITILLIFTDSWQDGANESMTEQARRWVTTKGGRKQKNNNTHRAYVTGFCGCGDENPSAIKLRELIEWPAVAFTKRTPLFGSQRTSAAPGPYGPTVSTVRDTVKSPI